MKTFSLVLVCIVTRLEKVTSHIIPRCRDPFFILHDNQLTGFISVPGLKLFKLLTLALLRCSNSSCWKPSSLCVLSYSWCSFSFVRNCWKYIHLQLKINQISLDWNASLSKWFKAEPNLIAVTLCYPMSKMQLLYMVSCLFWVSFRQLLNSPTEMWIYQKQKKVIYSDLHSRWNTIFLNTPLVLIMKKDDRKVK